MVSNNQPIQPIDAILKLKYLKIKTSHILVKKKIQNHSFCKEKKDGFV